MSFLLSSRLLPQKSLWNQSSNLDLFPSLHKYAVLWYSAGCWLDTFDTEIFLPYLKALPHARKTSAPLHQGPLLWQGRKLNVKEDLEARELCRGRAFLLVG